MHTRKAAGSAVVIAAKQFNPTVMGEIWLSENNIITKAELKDATNKVFVDGIAQVDCKDFALVVVGSQLQFVPKDAHRADVFERLKLLIGLIPHTPFTAIGINHSWQVTPVGVDTKEFSRRVFLRDDSPFAEMFSDDDSLFGGYFSKDIFGGRLKVDVQPAILASPESSQVVFITLNFNFHLELTGAGQKKVEAIYQHLSRWEEARSLTEKMTTRLAEYEIK